MLCFASRRIALLIFMFINFFLYRRASSFVLRPVDTVPRRTRRTGGLSLPFPLCATVQSRLFSSSSSSNALSEDDRKFLKEAINHAERGVGATFPNPAVGCVLVRQDTRQVVGAGYHPRAGYPHAEVFALLEAAGHLPKASVSGSSRSGGVAAADAIQKQDNVPLMHHVETLLGQYSSKDGTEGLFGNAFSSNALKNCAITAYVTLEPCCHFGKTPPCALAFIAAKAINRVVVGFRDPNPRVDGGGVQLLETAGIKVHLVGGGGNDKDSDLATACQDLVTNFVKRITPSARHDDYSYITGKMRRALRKLVNHKKQDGTLAQVQWSKSSTLPTSSLNNNDDSDSASALPIPTPEWMEHLDGVLWQNEIVLLRLNNIVSKKKQAKALGTDIAQALRAHVAQTVGHTVLLYRPAIPRPILNLDELAANSTDEEEQ